MHQYDTYAEKLQHHAAAPLLCPDIYHAQNYTFCNWSTTAIGWDVNTERWNVVAVTCKRWGCPYCALRKIRRLAWLCKNAEPSRLLTLTVSDKRFDHDDKAAWEAMSKAFPELIRFIRKEKKTCEYLRVLEIQANGTPHFHCMMKMPFIPHSQLLAEWRRLIGKPEKFVSSDDNPAPKEWAGVNIKRIDQTFRTFRYLVKYLTKLHKIPWTDRHVSYSKGFFNPEDTEPVEYAKLEAIERSDKHPWIWLQERYSGATVKVLDHGKWELPGEQIPDRLFTIDPTAIGLPPDPDNAPPLPLTQRLVPGLTDKEIDDVDKDLKPDGTRKKRRPRKPPVNWPPRSHEQPVPENPF